MIETAGAAAIEIETDFVPVCTPSVALNWTVVLPSVVGVPVTYAVQVLSPLSVVEPNDKPGGRLNPLSTLIAMVPVAFGWRETVTLPL